MKHRFAIAVLALATLFAVQLLAPALAAACSYGPDYTPRQMLRDASAAFVGTVVAASEERHSQPDGRSYKAVNTYRFRVATSWKGISTPEVIIVFRSQVFLPEQGNLAPGTCPYPEGFKLGAMYLVYAYRSGEDSELRASTRLGKATREIQSLADVETEFNLFGPGKQWDQPAGLGMPQAGHEMNLHLLLGVSLAMLSLGAGLSIYGRCHTKPARGS